MVRRPYSRPVLLLPLLLLASSCCAEWHPGQKARPKGKAVKRHAANGAAANFHPHVAHPHQGAAGASPHWPTRDDLLPFPPDTTESEVQQVMDVVRALKGRIRWEEKEPPSHPNTKVFLMKINRSGSTELFSRLSALPKVCASFSELDRVLFFNKKFKVFLAQTRAQT